jgi:hypothetical protein
VTQAELEAVLLAGAADMGPPPPVKATRKGAAKPAKKRAKPAARKASPRVAKKQVKPKKRAKSAR